MTINQEPIPMTIEERRTTIELVALDGLTVAGTIGDNRDDFIEYLLVAICRELLETSVKLNQEVSPALQVLGQWSGGILGTGTVAEDEISLCMYQRGRELREHITKTIGWPVARSVTRATAEG